MEKLENAFYFDYDYLDGSHNTVIEGLFDKHFDKYLAGHEISKSGIKHLQCWVISKNQQSYTNFIQKIVKLLSLCGRATKDVRKQYGRIKGVINDTNAILSYCLKEKRGYWSKGLDEDFLQERLEDSYEKAPTKQQKYDDFLLDCRIAVHPYREPEFCENEYARYNRKINQCIEISKIYYEKYDNVIPNTLVDKTLLRLDLVTHRELASRKFITYLGADPSMTHY